MSPAPVTGVVLDLDGVLRHVPVRVEADACAAASIPAGSILAAAFAEERLLPAVTGRITDAAWRHASRHALRRRAPARREHGAGRRAELVGDAAGRGPRRPGPRPATATRAAAGRPADQRHEALLFADDSPGHVAAAKALGRQGHRFTTVDRLAAAVQPS